MMFNTGFWKGPLAAGAIAVITGLTATSAAADCGKVTIADMNWDSAELAAYVDKFILINGYGCDAELVPGDTMPTVTSMSEKAEPDVAPEIWMNSVRQVINASVKEGRLAVAGNILTDGGVEGLWIPRYVLDAHPELTTVQAVLKRPDLFPASENKSRGAVHNCPSGWNCQLITDNLFRAYDMEKAGFDLIDTGSSAGLNGSIAKAYERKEGWFGYYWSPTAILGKYDMVKLDLGVDHDPKEWDRCTGQGDCVDPVPNGFAKGIVTTITSASFAKNSPEAFAYLSNRSWKNVVVNEMLSFMADEQSGGEIGAEEFFKRHPEVWTKWVPDAVAAKIKAAL